MKAVLSMRERLTDNSAGKVVNGRQLNVPVVPVRVGHKRQSMTNIRGGMDSFR